MSDLLVFSHLRWGFVYQRPQHLMSRLAAQRRVFFIEEPVFDDSAPARLSVATPAPGVWVVTPHTAVAAPGFHDDQLPVLKPLLHEFIHQHALHDVVAWFYTPMALPLLEPTLPRAVVYDCMDELSNFAGAPRQLRQRESALLKWADLLITGGPSLYRAKKDQHAHAYCLPSAVDAAHFAPARLRADDPEAQAAQALQQALPRPRLGFFGVIDERLDLPLLDAVAQARPQWQWVMAGPVVKIDPATLPQRANLHWLGMQPYARLPHLVAGWDVCLMPFARNEATLFISPTKTLEYLAAGKPVVSTPITDVIDLYGKAVHLADNAHDFIARCEAALAPTAQQARALAQASHELVAASSWDRSAELVRVWLDEAVARRARSAAVVPPQPPAADAPPAPAVRTSARQVQQLIVGAGPTGLAAAYELGQGARREDTLLVERNDRVGGWCRSVHDRGFTFDCAGHIMFSNDAYVLELYQRLLGDNVHWQNREAWIYSKNVYTRYPFQGSLYGLPPEVLKECLVGAIEARFGPLSGHGLTAPRAEPTNFEQFIQQVWGAGIAKHFATPYNRKLWTVPLAEMETSWLGGRVPLPDLEQMIQGALEPTPAPMGPNARFGYPLRGGFQALMDGFVPLLNCELALNTSVSNVSPSQRTARLDDGRTIGFDTLVSTMPLPLLVQACGNEAPEAVRAAAQGLRHVAVRCVNLGVALPPGTRTLTDKHWIYYPEDTVFHRIFVQGNASPHNNAEGGFALTCEISYSPHKPLPCEGEALIQRVIEDCHRVGIFGPEDEVVVANQVDMPCAYVVYDHARAANVACIRDWLAGFDIVLAGRYSEWEYYNSDHAFLAGRKAAAAVRAGREAASRAEAQEAADAAQAAPTAEAAAT